MTVSMSRRITEAVIASGTKRPITCANISSLLPRKSAFSPGSVVDMSRVTSKKCLADGGTASSLGRITKKGGPAVETAPSEITEDLCRYPLREKWVRDVVAYGEARVALRIPTSHEVGMQKCEA
jgi:hypothetical protein